MSAFPEEGYGSVGATRPDPHAEKGLTGLAGTEDRRHAPGNPCDTRQLLRIVKGPGPYFPHTKTRAPAAELGCIRISYALQGT
jgi:hypothetical protein